MAFNFTIPLTWDGVMPRQFPIDLETE
jgi:hypothetical protein